MVLTLVTNIIFLLTVACYALAQGGNYPLMYGDPSILKGASQACINTFNSNVTCTQAIGSLYADPYPNLTERVLDSLCTATCFDSLVNLRSEVASQCGSGVTYQDVSDGSYWPVTYLADLAIFNYNMTCLPRRFVSSHDTNRITDHANLIAVTASTATSGFKLVPTPQLNRNVTSAI
jgi:hypothetical protein